MILSRSRVPFVDDCLCVSVEPVSNSTRKSILMIYGSRSADLTIVLAARGEISTDIGIDWLVDHRVLRDWTYVVGRLGNWPKQPMLARR